MGRLALSFLLLGCGGSVVIHNHHSTSGSTGTATTTGTATAGTATAQPTRVQTQMRVRVQAHAPDPSSSGSVHIADGIDVSELDANVCDGLTVDEAGETRSGRQLGMGLLQVYARPGAQLLVDRRYQGETPLIAVGVDAGPRDVRLRNADLGYDCTFRLRVLPGVRYSLLLDVKDPELSP